MRFRSTRTTDQRLVGDGLAALYEDYSPRLVGFFMRRVFDPQAAVDLMAETFAQILLSRGRFRGESDAELEAWIFAIGRNQLARYQRKGYAERRALDRLGLQAPVLADDEFAILSLLRDTFEDAGYAVIVAHDGREAFAKAQPKKHGDAQARVLDGMTLEEHLMNVYGITRDTVRQAGETKGLGYDATTAQSSCCDSGGGGCC